MKKVLERIESTKQQIAHLQDCREKALQTAEKNIAKYANKPDYVVEWLQNWMHTANHHAERIEELEAELGILEWVIAD